MTASKSPSAGYLRPKSAFAQQAGQRLQKSLAGIGNNDTHYLRCFRTTQGRQLALSRVNAGIDVWTDAVWEHTPARFQPMRKKHYTANERRIATLEANAARLYEGSAADYRRLPTLGDLDAFTDWYKTL
jgi:hypothetical protein